MRIDGVIITNDLYFETVHEKELKNKVKINDKSESSSALKNRITEINEEMHLANNVGPDNVEEINDSNNIIQTEESVDNNESKPDMNDIYPKAEEIDTPHGSSSGQYTSQVIKQDVEELSEQTSQELKEEKQNESQENLNQEEVQENKITNEVTENHIIPNIEKEISRSVTEKEESKIKSAAQEIEKDAIDKGLGKEALFKEEWEKTLVEWIEKSKIKSISSEKKEELVEIIKKYHEIRDLYKIYFNLNHERGKITEDDKFEALINKLRIIDYKEKEMFKELNGFRHFYKYNKTRWYDSVINSRKEKYPELLAKKLKSLKDETTSEVRELHDQELKELSVEAKKDNFELLKERYKQETGRRPIYAGRETKGFKSWRERLLETQEEINEEISEVSHDIREEWVDVLLNHIHTIPDEEISQGIKEELTYITNNYGKLQKTSKNLPPNLKQLIEELEQFQTTYNICKEREYEKSIPLEVGKVSKKLRKQLERFKIEAILKAFLHKEKLNKENEEGASSEIIPSVNNWRELLKANLYKIAMLTLKEKSQINKLIQKEELSKDDKKRLTFLLSKVKNEDLIALFGKSFENFLNTRIETLNIDIPDFREEVITHIKKLVNLFECMIDQKQYLMSKSLEILDKHIERAKNGEFTIPIDANLKVIASAITYTSIISSKDMPKISARGIANKVNIKAPNYITKYYKKHFELLYPRIEFRFASYDFGKIRQIISLYFFEFIKDTEIEISKLVSCLRENILKSLDLPKQLKEKDIKVLYKLATHYRDEFTKYFTDLVEIVKHLFISSKIHKKIGAHLMVKPLAKFLNEEEINLFQTSEVFSRSIRDIFDFLSEKFPNFFPFRAHTQKKESEYHYRKIIGYKLKLYVIKHIYNGKYFINGEFKCPKCQEEELIINADLSRLEALEFHHDSVKKENMFKAEDLYNYFIRNRANSHVLEDLIKLMESEQVITVCRNHHLILHDKYYKYFRYLINWENIFSMPSELIHILIMTCVNNFHKTKNLPKRNKQDIRGKIVRKLKKKYIIECLYGTYCSTCGEISTKEHLTAFEFNHKDEDTKTVNASDLFTQTLSCSEIIKILKQEIGGYLCSNCHTVFHYKHLHLLDEIYEDRNVTNSVLTDFNIVVRNFKLIQNIDSIKDPLEKSDIITPNIEKYLTAIYKITESGQEVTNRALRDYLGLSRQTITDFFTKNMSNSFFRQCIDIINGTAPMPTKYILNVKGRKVVSLIFHFRDYYMNKN